MKGKIEGWRNREKYMESGMRDKQTEAGMDGEMYIRRQEEREKDLTV